ncbi:hypothetical protein FHS39_004546 [Streptomyces olivoverticillatus]|uniref:Uncharacterized protein n=1 Tax=Streptomyces olivoverticillatus TaxID=66427 RepID=A0A7W7LTF6_9ACTN|nr:hypothetical protein [Streptomyces olivoverticillatus]MBB4895468.1 hypothetical protein [Streptomyces olivoverticillatus]
MNPRRKFQLAAAFGSVGLVATALVTATPASAQPVVVPCSVTDLVTAITNANTAGSGDLMLTNGCTYSLTSPVSVPAELGLPQITGDIHIDGLGATITRSTTATQLFRIFDVAPGGQLTLGTVTLTGGTATGDGGAITNAGTLTLNAAQITKNVAGGSGGGIANTGTLNATASRITGNTAATGGGGLFNSIAAATANLRASSVDGNTTTGGNGGGILNNGGNITGDLSSLGSNSATGTTSSGGGIATVGGTVKLALDAVTDNKSSTVPGGIRNDGGTVSLLLTGVLNNLPSNCSGSPTLVPGCLN